MEGHEYDPPLTNGSQWYVKMDDRQEIIDELSNGHEEGESSTPRGTTRGDNPRISTSSSDYILSQSPKTIKLRTCINNDIVDDYDDDRISGSIIVDDVDSYVNNTDILVKVSRPVVVGSVNIQRPTTSRPRTNIKDDLKILQAIVFIEDAAKYRDICHKIDKESLCLYRVYHSRVISWVRYFVITLLHLLAFIEFPSSFTWTSDIRYRGERISAPCGVTEGVELACLLFILADVLIKIRLIGKEEICKKKWLIAAMVFICLSLIDWMVTIGTQCNETNRIRRIVRPFFILSNSSLMKKTVKCVQRTLPQVVSVLLLLALHLYVFTLLGMLLFPNTGSENDDTKNKTTGYFVLRNSSNTTTMLPIANATSIPVQQQEGSQYFRTLIDSFMSLLVLLTTANNPDVMMPAYQNNRFFALYFIIFLLIGNYCFMNMFLAVIFNQFRGYFKTSMQASLLRRRVGVRAAYEILQESDKYYSSGENTSGVTVETVRLVVADAALPIRVKAAIFEDLKQRKSSQVNSLSSKQFQDCFDNIERESFRREKPEIRWFSHRYVRVFQRCVAHRFYNYFGNVVALVNVVMISVELATQYDKTIHSSKSALNILNFAFILYYLVEQVVKFVALGWKRYVYNKWNIFDGLITVALVISEVCSIIEYGLPLSGHDRQDSITLWNAVRIINILIMVRLLRIIPHIKAMSIVANTLVDLIRNLRAFGGVLIVMYYSFAILGIELFHDTIKYNTSIHSQVYECGSYQQLEYWANNFDDFAAALVVLWDVMVVNNWSIFLKAYAKALSDWSYLYFIAWWLVSVIIILQIFTSLIIENFTMKWDKSCQQIAEEQRQRDQSQFTESVRYMDIYDMFRENLEEPPEEQILEEISKHRYLNLPLNPH